MEEVEWIDLEELLNKSIGEFKKMLSYSDEHSSFKDFLVENGWIILGEEAEGFEEQEFWESLEEKNLAHKIGEDIVNGAYSLESIEHLYDQDFIDKVKYLID